MSFSNPQVVLNISARYTGSAKDEFYANLDIFSVPHEVCQ
jgi:hypothetical protein